MRRLLLVPMVLGTMGVSFGQPAVDWGKQKAETLQHFLSLVRIDTSNPPGNETKVVEYLKKVLEADGIPTRIFALDSSRTNLVARLKGHGTKRPILILAHTDVVARKVAGGSLRRRS